MRRTYEEALAAGKRHIESTGRACVPAPNSTGIRWLGIEKRAAAPGGQQYPVVRVRIPGVPNTMFGFVESTLEAFDTAADAPKRTTYLADGVTLATPPGSVQGESKPSDGEHFLFERFLIREEPRFRPGVDEAKTRKCGRRELFGVGSDIRFAETDARVFIPKGHRLHADHLMHVRMHEGVEVIEVEGFDYDAELALWQKEQA